MFIRSTIISLCMLTSIASLYASPYKSTENMRTNINDTYAFILENDTIYKVPHMLESLRNLGTGLNTHVMGKQGILLGKKEAKSEYKKKIVLDNIFNLWDEHIYPTFQTLVNTIQTLRLSPNDENARDMLERWRDSGSWKTMAGYVATVKANTIVGDKKKLADLITLFIEKNIALINRAWVDLKK